MNKPERCPSEWGRVTWIGCQPRPAQWPADKVIRGPDDPHAMGRVILTEGETVFYGIAENRG